MCRQTLDGYLRDQTGIEQSELNGLREEAADWNEAQVHLFSADANRLHDALDKLTFVDPAVGSGAFLVGMLQEMVLLRRGINSALTNRDTERSSELVRGWKERAITRSLYGVDINPAAVEICRLRLWLSLVIDADVDTIRNIPPLPNLEFRVVAGDSLIDRMGKEPFIESLGIAGVGIGLDFEMERRHTELKALRTEYDQASGRGQVNRVRALGEQIREKQFEIASVQLNAAIRKAKAELSGVRSLPRASEAKKRAAANKVAALEAMHAGLSPDAPFLKPLLWKLAFPHVFDEGGFDIVVANPPYVRQESIDPIDQEAYEAAFPAVYAGTADLYVFFFARALQLLKPKGWLAFITSNKYMRANYGAKLRAALPAKLQLAEVIDFGDLPVFSVAAYPAVVVGRKAAEPERDAPVTVADLTVPIRRAIRAAEKPATLESVRGELEDVPGLVKANKAAGFTQGLLRGGGWILEDPVLIRLFDRLMNEGTPLGQYVDGRIYYGIKTGFNEAFVIDQATRDALIAADPASADLIKSWLRGRDIKRWKPEWAGLHLIAIQNSGDRDAANPWADAPTEAAARAIFAKTYPAIHDHLSQYEAKLRPRADQGRFWWELRACTYYAEFQQPKVIMTHFLNWAAFAYDLSGAFHNNAATFVVAPRPATAALVNSTLGWFVLSTMGTALQNGYTQMFVEFFERFPVPVKRLDGNADASRLDAEVLRLQSEASDATTEATIDALVEALYCVTSEERQALEVWKSRRRSALDEQVTVADE